MSENSYTHLAKQLEVSSKAIQRLTGSTKVELTKPGELEPVQYEIGLRIERKFLSGGPSLPELNESDILKSINDYSQNCPAVYRWICSGNFTSDKLPESVSIASVIHACRTAGRLRSELIRLKV